MSVQPPPRGLPPRIAIPILAVVAAAFLGVMWYFLSIGFAQTGTALGGAVPEQGDARIAVTPAPQTGGPPAPVMRALAALQARVARNPHDADALAALGALYLEAGKDAQAAEYYAAAVRVHPSDPELRTDYAVALHGAGHDAAALAQLDTVLRAHEDYPQALYDRGVVAASSGHRAEAVAAFKTFLRVAPGDPHAADARAALQDIGAQGG